MLTVIGVVVAPVFTIMAFVLGVKMEAGRQNRTIARLQMQNMELEDEIRDVKHQLNALYYEDSKHDWFEEVHIIEESA